MREYQALWRYSPFNFDVSLVDSGLGQLMDSPEIAYVLARESELSVTGLCLNHTRWFKSGFASMLCKIPREQKATTNIAFEFFINSIIFRFRQLDTSFIFRFSSFFVTSLICLIHFFLFIILLSQSFYYNLLFHFFPLLLRTYLSSFTDIFVN